MDTEKLREATERRKKGELDEIEDTSRNEISKRFGSGESDPGKGRQQTMPGSDSMRSDTNSNSMRKDVQLEDENPNSVKKGRSG